MAMKEQSGSGHSKTLLGPPAVVLVGDWNWPIFLHVAKKSQLLTVDSGLVDCFWFLQQQHKNKIGFWVLVLFCTFPFYSGWFLTPFHSFLVAFLLVLFPVFFASAPVIIAVFPKATATSIFHLMKMLQIYKYVYLSQGCIACGAIEEASRSSKAINERVIINFCDKNVVIARFRNKNVAIARFRDKCSFTTKQRMFGWEYYPLKSA